MNQVVIEDWIIHKLGLIIGKSQKPMAPSSTFTQLGLDSATAFALCGELEDWLGIEVEPTVFRKHKTITDLAGSLAKRTSALTSEKELGESA